MNTIHIGHEIQAVFKDKGWSISLFAEKLHFDRTNIYRIFKRKSIDTDLLFEISKVLNYNFFTLYSPQNRDK